jgi:hypothetical protein
MIPGKSNSCQTQIILQIALKGFIAKNKCTNIER